jgi:hypothetical protein
MVQSLSLGPNGASEILRSPGRTMDEAWQLRYRAQSFMHTSPWYFCRHSLLIWTTESKPCVLGEAYNKYIALLYHDFECRGCNMGAIPGLPKPSSISRDHGAYTDDDVFPAELGRGEGGLCGWLQIDSLEITRARIFVLCWKQKMMIIDQKKRTEEAEYQQNGRSRAT